MSSKRMALAVGILTVGLALLWQTGGRGSAAIAGRGMAARSDSGPTGVGGTRASSDGGGGRERGAAIPVTDAELRAEHSEVWPPALETPEDLGVLIAWMRSLDQEELLRLSNAEFDFRESALIDLLHGLEGDWVVPVLGEAAQLESDPLMKAVLVEGLCGDLKFSRIDDERVIAVLAGLLPQLSAAELDPYDVGREVIGMTFSACLRQGADYVEMVEPSLSTADNPLFLFSGYSWVGRFPGGADLLERVLVQHPEVQGRAGAIMGLRAAVGGGWLAPETATELGLLALEDEEDAGNRSSLLGMIASVGGESGRAALEGLVLARDPELMGEAAELLALTAGSHETLTLIEGALSEPGLSPETRTAMYQALGALPDGAGVNRLLSVATDDELPSGERLAGLTGLWNGPMTEDLSRSLKALVHSDDDPAVRIEALRMLSCGEGRTDGLDLRGLADLDPDPAVRSEAILMASMEPDEDNRQWLEERLVQDSSVEVKAAALGALVMHAHYAGGGDAALGYLNRAETFTTDPGVLEMIRRGKSMVADFDSRRLDLGLEADARLWEKVAGMTEGAASRSFRRRSQQLYKVIAALRAGSR